MHYTGLMDASAAGSIKSKITTLELYSVKK